MGGAQARDGAVGSRTVPGRVDEPHELGEVVAEGSPDVRLAGAQRSAAGLRLARQVGAQLSMAAWTRASGALIGA
jgi:hypothetical protein